MYGSRKGKNVLIIPVYVVPRRRGFPGFQVIGMIEGFLGFEIFNSRIFCGKVYFGWLDLSRNFVGCSKQSNEIWDGIFWGFVGSPRNVWRF